MSVKHHRPQSALTQELRCVFACKYFLAALLGICIVGKLSDENPKGRGAVRLGGGSEPKCVFS